MLTMVGIREESTNGVIDVVADKGYEQPEDMIECLGNGIIPHVITDDGKEGYDLEIPYTESPDADVTSTEPEELKKCLQARKIPDAYEHLVTKAEVKEVRRIEDTLESG